MKTNYKFNNGGTITDFDDVFIRKDIFSTGALFGWGDNVAYQVSTSAFDRTTATQRTDSVSTGGEWKDISAGGFHSVAIKSDGRLYGWGNNTDGELGDGTATIRSIPVQTISSGTDWKQASAGLYHTTAIKTDGTLWTWGLNDNGQLGTNDIVNTSSPIQTVAGGANWKQVSAGFFHTAAIKTDGTLWSWGRNTSGELGTNNTISTSSPVQTISGGTNWKQVSAGDGHTAAIKTDGTLWLWGRNDYGALGANLLNAAISSPVQTISGGTNWKQVSAGQSTTGAIKTDGTLWMWGKNDFGQLGVNYTSPNQINSPVQTVAGGTNWKSMQVGGWHVSAIKTDGTIWSWGLNNNGQLGIGNFSNASSPVQLLVGGTNWKIVSAGGYHSLSIQDYS